MPGSGAFSKVVRPSPRRPAAPPGNIESWGVAEVRKWLEEDVGGPLQKYGKVFEEQEIDGIFLVTTSEKDLRESLSLPLGHARRLSVAIRELVASEQEGGEGNAPVRSSGSSASLSPPLSVGERSPPPREADVPSLRQIEQLDREVEAIPPGDLDKLFSAVRVAESMLQQLRSSGSMTPDTKEKSSRLEKTVVRVQESVAKAGKGPISGVTMTMSSLTKIKPIGLDQDGDPKGKQGAQLWLGRWNKLNYDVCIKEMKLDARQARELSSAEANFQNEVQLMSQVQHPNICMFLGGCIDDNSIVLVTELLAMDLSGFMQTSQEYRDYSPSKRMLLGKGIAQGMAWLHAQGIVHNDLKPDNVLLDKYFVPRIADFGYSRLLPGSMHNSRTDQNSLVGGGSPLYMAPERLQRRVTNEKACDVYSFAIILWEILTGDTPFTEFLHSPDPNAVEKFFSSVCDAHYRPRLPSEMPAAIQQLLKNLWQPEVEKRKTFAEILDHFDDIVVRVACTDNGAAMLWRSHFVTRQIQTGFGEPSLAESASEESRTVNMLQSEVPWDDFKFPFCGAIGLDLDVATASVIIDPNQEELGRNPSDAELAVADDNALEIFAKRKTSKGNDDPMHPANRVFRERHRRELTIKLDAARELFCDAGQKVTLERFGMITAMFGPLLDSSSVASGLNSATPESGTQELVMARHMNQHPSIVNRIFDLMNKPYFRRDMNAKQAFELLRYEDKGAFILRFSSSTQAFVFSVVKQKASSKKREVVHCRLNYNRPDLDSPSNNLPSGGMSVDALANGPNGGAEAVGFSMPGPGSRVYQTIDELIKGESLLLVKPITQATASVSRWLRGMNADANYMKAMPIYYQPGSVVGSHTA